MIGLPLIFIIAVSVVGGTIDLQGLIDSMKEKPPAEVAILFIIVTWPTAYARKCGWNFGPAENFDCFCEKFYVTTRPTEILPAQKS